ncbi:Hypothetical protein, putative [Bodo saltans]|uniref:Uncharacterized protein n=1 Tax=Bodo saltans TaxID=75058 RepID=A0A0S4IXC7_BODSA|nr:Hypothetical protein, putative [Bodo saltans]|eukprot:CUG38757.1 Hypothetical protein, putative [Bodo saltans]
MECLRLLHESDCPLIALRKVAWQSIMSTARDITLSPSPTSSSSISMSLEDKANAKGRLQLDSCDATNTSGTNISSSRFVNAPTHSILELPTKKLIPRSPALYATERHESNNILANEEALPRRFWFLSGGVERITTTHRKRGRCDDDNDDGDDAAPEESRFDEGEDQREEPSLPTRGVKKTIRFFISDVCLCCPNGVLEPLDADLPPPPRTNEISAALSSSYLSGANKRHSCMPSPILLGKAEQASQLTVSAFSYEATKRLRLFVSNNPTFFENNELEGGLSRDGVLRTINEAARGLGDMLSRAAGAIVTGHVIALSRLLDGNALIPKEFLSSSQSHHHTDEDTSTARVGQESNNKPSRLYRSISVDSDERLQSIHLMPLLVSPGGWSTSAQLKEEVATFLKTQEQIPIVRMLLVPMAPLQEK